MKRLSSFYVIFHSFIENKRQKMSAEVNDEKKSNLIDLVYAQPSLWRMNSDVYHKTRPKEKKQLWIKIAAVLGLDSKY